MSHLSTYLLLCMNSHARYMGSMSSLSFTAGITVMDERLFVQRLNHIADCMVDDTVPKRRSAYKALFRFVYHECIIHTWPVGLVTQICNYRPYLIFGGIGEFKRIIPVPFAFSCFQVCRKNIFKRCNLRIQVFVCFHNGSKLTRLSMDSR